MDKSRQRTKKRQLNSSFIIKSKKSWWRECIVALFTLIVWFYCMTVVFFFIDALFSLNYEYPRLFKIIFKMNNDDIQGFFKIGGILFVLIYISLSIWIYYNKKKYGQLKRRKDPGLTTKEDMLKLDVIGENTYEELQCSKVITLETNPIRNGED